MPSPLINNEGLFRIGGMWGAAWDVSGKLLAEVTEVTATAELNRIEVPLVGTNKQGYKPGRVSRQGTFRVQKIDAKYELDVWAVVNASIDERRAMRGTANSVLRPFTLIVGYDDPEALGVEKWQLNGCLLWSLPLGYNIGDDIRDLEFPFTYEMEQPLEAFVRTGVTNPATGLPGIQQVFSAQTQSGQQVPAQ
jgi:hypothetical protein